MTQEKEYPDFLKLLPIIIQRGINDNIEDNGFRLN